MNKLKIEDRLAIMWTLIDSQGYSVLKNPEFFVIAIVDFFLQKKNFKIQYNLGTLLSRNTSERENR